MRFPTGERTGDTLRPGWPAGLVALALTAVTAVLVERWSVQAPWLALRGALGSVLLVTAGLAIGSSSLIGLASVPLLAAAAVGIDRPTGHAWGQALVLAVLWYLACEAAWASIEARSDTVRSPAIGRQRVREIAVVAVTSILVGVAGIALASMAPVRTATVRAVAVAIVLVGLAALGRHLTARSTPAERTSRRQPNPGGTDP